MKMHREAKSFLKENDEIVILKSDKGNITIADYRTNYKQMMSLLNDNSDYKEVKRIPVCVRLKNGIMRL